SSIEKDWKKVEKRNTTESLYKFEAKYPNSKFQNLIDQKILSLKCDSITSRLFPDLERTEIQGEISVVVSEGGTTEEGSMRFYSDMYIIDNEKRWHPLFSALVPGNIAFKDYTFESGKKCRVYGNEIIESAQTPISEIQVQIDKSNILLNEIFKRLNEREKNFVRSDSLYNFSNYRDIIDDSFYANLLSIYENLLMVRIYSNYKMYLNNKENSILIDSIFFEN
ncbi:hypothetical protein N9164_10760, partial [Draconibacterium sp.]|nr:hypothetical protein [Draconibacterium sp.]